MVDGEDYRKKYYELRPVGFTTPCADGLRPVGAYSLV